MHNYNFPVMPTLAQQEICISALDGCYVNRWMIVLVDSYDRETVADIVKAENLGHADAAAIVERMQLEYSYERHISRWPVMRRMGAKLCRGMEDLV